MILVNLHMARIFNIYFTYQEVTYNAIVSVRETPFFKEYTLKNIDESILKQLPADKIISRSKEDFIFQNAPNDPTDLMKEIIRAVANHLYKVDA